MVQGEVGLSPQQLAHLLAMAQERLADNDPFAALGVCSHLLYTPFCFCPAAFVPKVLFRRVHKWPDGVEADQQCIRAPSYSLVRQEVWWRAGNHGRSDGCWRAGHGPQRCSKVRKTLPRHTTMHLEADLEIVSLHTAQYRSGYKFFASAGYKQP